ncbi:MAG: tetratricopeptide repeat protein [Phycisphaerae bacterium]|nr:tetratricopeptide repeat protein [Phycisphaerae bacterium]
MSNRLEQLLKLVKIAGNDPLSHYGLALEYINLQRWTDAVAAFDATLAINPQYSAAIYHKGRAQIAANLHDEARTTLTQGIEVAKKQGDWKTADEMRGLLETIE